MKNSCKHCCSVLLFLLLLATGADSFAQRDVNLSFPSGTLTLNGVLTLPSGPGPFPLLVLVHGSGPQNRNVSTPLVGGNFPCLYPGISGQTVRPFKDLRDGLVNYGYAVFSYDKRTLTYGATLDQTRIRVHDYARDAHAAINFLKTRPEVDTSCIILLGHSQGGCVTALVARERSDLSALVSLAGPATPIDTLVAEQVRYIYRTCADSATGVSLANQLLAAYGSVRNGTWPSGTPISGVYPNFWESWIHLADSVFFNYNTAGLPVLFVHGDDDYNVPVRDTARWQSSIAVDSFSVQVFAGLNHFLSPANDPRVSPDVIDAVGQWLPICRVTATDPLRVTDMHFRAGEGWLEVGLADGRLIGSWAVFDLQGRRLATGNNVERHLKIDTSSLPPGMKILQVEDRQGQVLRQNFY